MRKVYNRTRSLRHSGTRLDSTIVLSSLYIFVIFKQSQLNMQKKYGLIDDISNVNINNVLYSWKFVGIYLFSPVIFK